MSTNVNKVISSESSYVKANNTRSSPNVFDDDATEFKPNIIETEHRIRSKHITMGGISIPHHGLAAAIQSHGSANVSNAVNHHLHYSSLGNGKTPNELSANSGIQSHATNNNYDSCKSPFLLPAQLYKSLFANAVLQSSDKICSHPFPRNLLFSYAEKSPASSDFDAEDKNSIVDEVSLFGAFSLHSFLLLFGRTTFPFFILYLFFLFYYNTYSFNLINLVHKQH